MPPFEVLKSEKNRDVLLVDGYLFWFDRATPRGRKYWKCIYCYRSHEGSVKDRCISRVITSQNDPNALICKGHNHERDMTLVDHMKTFGSIRRLTSALRKSTLTQNGSRRIPKKVEVRAEVASTSEPLDLSVKNGSRLTEEIGLERPQKNRKRVLADVLTTLYERIQEEKFTVPDIAAKKPCLNTFLHPQMSPLISPVDNHLYNLKLANLSSPFQNSPPPQTAVPLFPRIQYPCDLFTFQNLFYLAQKYSLNTALAQNLNC